MFISWNICYHTRKRTAVVEVRQTPSLLWIIDSPCLARNTFLLINIKEWSWPWTRNTNTSSCKRSITSAFHHFLRSTALLLGSLLPCIVVSCFGNKVICSDITKILSCFALIWFSAVKVPLPAAFYTLLWSHIEEFIRAAVYTCSSFEEWSLSWTILD